MMACRRFGAAAPPLLVLVGLVCIGLSARAQAQDSPRTAGLALPAAWVPFSADFMQSAPDDRAPDQGRFHRASDGSDRTELHTGTSVYVAIKNISTKTFYRREGGAEAAWVAHPMTLPPEGWVPPDALPESPDYSPLREPFEGLVAYRHQIKDSDVVSVVVPELNLFRVAAQFPGQKWIRFANITVGEPDPALFAPPEGASVAFDPRPDGIVYTAAP